MSKFCVEGSIDPKCVTFESYEFDSEEQIFDILLDVLKSELPGRLALVKGCDDKPLRIEEDAIGLIQSEGTDRLTLVLEPLGDIPNYAPSMVYRKVDYNFELILTAQNKEAQCVTWELIRFKNVVEGLIVGAEFAIDGYQSVDVEPKGFNYFPLEGSVGLYRRQGSYRFSVTVTQYKNN